MDAVNFRAPYIHGGGGMKSKSWEVGKNQRLKKMKIKTFFKSLHFCWFQNMILDYHKFYHLHFGTWGNEKKICLVSGHSDESFSVEGGGAMIFLSMF